MTPDDSHDEAPAPVGHEVSRGIDPLREMEIIAHEVANGAQNDRINVVIGPMYRIEIVGGGRSKVLASKPLDKFDRSTTTIGRVALLLVDIADKRMRDSQERVRRLRSELEMAEKALDDDVRRVDRLSEIIQENTILG